MDTRLEWLIALSIIGVFALGSLAFILRQILQSKRPIDVYRKREAGNDRLFI